MPKTNSTIKQLSSKIKILLTISFVIIVIFIARPRIDLPADVKIEMAALPEVIDYNVDVKPILSDKCFACHGPDVKKQKAGLRLDLASNAYNHKAKGSELKAIAPGNPSGSEMVRRILSTDPDDLMPTLASHLTLDPKQKAVLVKWIEHGAKYKPHWAFVNIEMPDVPSVKNETWARNDIDHFILKKLETENLQPSAEADKATSIRLVSFDVTGLPQQ